MKAFALLTLFMLSLFADPKSIKFYTESAKNQLLCKFTATSYKLINKNNSSIKVINKIHFFKLKNQNIYINSSSCHPLNTGTTPIIF